MKNNVVRNIIESKKIKTLNQLRVVIEYWHNNGHSDSDIINTIRDMEFCWQIKTIPPEDIANIILADINIKEYNVNINDIFIYKSEFECLLQIEDLIARKLMYCFLVYSKINNHSSGWIKYDKDFVFQICGISKNVGNQHIHICCQHGLELRVIGAKHSIVCYHIGFKKIDGEIYYQIKSYEEIMKLYDKFFEVEN